ncbi:unnamed protein product [Rhizophagus irregularis]|nr:unnamed protein product [Rhizophagus irregularis]CAB4439428.1 unnamed protein product [Rhizophagus irregularis]
MKANPNISQGNIALFFNDKYQDLNIDRTTISKIWKEHEKWLVVLPTSQTSHNYQNLKKLCKFGLYKQQQQAFLYQTQYYNLKE